MNARAIARLATCLALALACHREPATDTPPLQFWHTFNQGESAALLSWLAKSNATSVATTILPFARASSRLRRSVRGGTCPDLVRMDASRIPSLVEDEILTPVPQKIWQQRTWLKEAESLVRYRGKVYGIPQSLDGLALIRRRGQTGPWPLSSLSQLEDFSASQQLRRGKNTSELGILIDGYWFLAFLRSESVTLPNAHYQPSIRSPGAITALERFATFFRQGWAMDLLDERDPSRAMARAFRKDQISIAFTGPWDLVALSGGDISSLEVSAFPGQAAPRGGQILAVPRCAKAPARAWKLALGLSAPKLQAAWAKRLGMIPVTRAGLSQAGRVASEFHQAIAGGSLLPRHALAAKLFDDLSPAVMAVVGGGASAEDALAGVDRAWRRLYAAHQGAPREP